MEKSELKVGRRVTYVPEEGTIEKGIVKSIPEDSDQHAFVVFHCAQDWDNYKRYTGERTNIKYLKPGWEIPEHEKHSNRRQKVENMIREYPDMVEIINRDPIAHAWFNQWRASDISIEKGFFNLAVMMMQEKDSMLDAFNDYKRKKG